MDGHYTVCVAMIIDYNILYEWQINDTIVHIVIIFIIRKD